MSDLITICLVDVPEHERGADLYQAPHLAVAVGDEVEVAPGVYGTVWAVITEFTDSAEYKFACVAAGWSEEEGLPRLSGKRAYKTFDYGEEKAI